MAKAGPNELRKLLVKSLRGTPEDAENFRQAAKASTQDYPPEALKPQGVGGDPPRKWWDRNPIVKAAAGEGARRAKLGLGAARGAAHAAEGLVGIGVLAERLAHPNLETLLRPPGMTAKDDVDRMVRGGIDYVRTSTPKKVVSDIGEQLGRFRASVDPTATPQSPTLLGEIDRNIGIGMNQGEVAFDVGSTVYGGEAVEGLAGLGGLSKASTAAKYVELGHPPELARYFATRNPERSMGHHFLKRAVVKKTPAPLKPVVQSISESRFSVLKPKGMSRGDFYRLHYEVDPDYWGGKAGKEFGGVRWSGKKLGWQKHGLLGQVVNGSPPPLKAAVISPSLITAGAFVNRPNSRGESR